MRSSPLSFGRRGGLRLVADHGVADPAVDLSSRATLHDAWEGEQCAG